MKAETITDNENKKFFHQQDGNFTEIAIHKFLIGQIFFKVARLFFSEVLIFQNRKF